MCVCFRISDVVLISYFTLHHYAVCSGFVVCVSGFVIVVILFHVVIGTIVEVGVVVVVMGFALS